MCQRSTKGERTYEEEKEEEGEEELGRVIGSNKQAPRR